VVFSLSRIFPGNPFLWANYYLAEARLSATIYGRCVLDKWLTVVEYSSLARKWFLMRVAIGSWFRTAAAWWTSF
jgi:hypothetical protein